MHRAFGSQTLAEIFRDLYLEERTGVLRLRRDDLEKKVFFDRGMILLAHSDLPEEDLGARLVHEGKLSPGALAEAGADGSDPVALAQAMLNRGLVTKDTLGETAHVVVLRVVKSAFKWESGTADFDDGVHLAEGLFDGDILSTFETILTGIQSMTGFSEIRDAMMGVENRLRLRDPAPIPVERLALSPAHGFILSRVDGRTNTGNVVSILPQGEEDLACRFLYGLLVMGVLDHDPPLHDGPFRVSSILADHADQVALERMQESTILEAYDRLREQTPYQVLGLQPGASWEEAEQAYAEAKERFSRDRLLPRVREKLKAELSLIESRLVEAFLTLTHARVSDSRETAQAEDGDQQEKVGAESLFVRVEMDKTKTKRALEENSRLAEAHYGKARRYLREADFHNAIQYGKLAISYNPDDARYYFLVGECQSRNPEARWQRMAEQNFVRATELDPWNTDYRITLGRFYRRRGMKLRAKKQFEQVLRLVPTHENAIAELETLR